jgi:hypothetical protein
MCGPENDPTGEEWNALPRAGDDFCVKCAGEFAESLARKEIPQTPVTPRTVRVRLFMPVSICGDHADAYHSKDRALAVGAEIWGQWHCVTIEADVPLPEEPEVIEGRVVE